MTMKTESKRRWSPVDIVKAVRAHTLPMQEITEPPCKHCTYWKPRIVTDSYGLPVSLRCCQSSEMYFDFSCFKERDQ